jgi:hypothetical protein
MRQQEELVEQALVRAEKSIFELLWPSKTTLAIREHKHLIVTDQLETERRIIEELNSIGVRLIQGELDRLLKEAIARNMTQLVAMKNELQRNLMIEWEASCMNLKDTLAWAITEPDFAEDTRLLVAEIKKDTFEMIRQSLSDFRKMAHRSLVGE